MFKLRYPMGETLLFVAGVQESKNRISVVFSEKLKRKSKKSIYTELEIHPGSTPAHHHVGENATS